MVDYTFYFYGSNLRASNAGVNDAMVASQVKRTSAAPALPFDINTSTKSVTYYVGSVNEEQSNYTEKYAAGSIVDYTTYFYDVSGINTRASLATANQKMTASYTSRLAMATSMSATSNTKSITYYSGNTNEEKSNYTAKYAGTLAVDYTFYFYGSLNTRAPRREPIQ